MAPSALARIRWREFSGGRAASVSVVLAVALSGCGSSALSTPVLRSRAGRICRLANVREQRIATPKSSAQGAAFLRSGATVLNKELRALRALTAGGTAAPVYARALSRLGAELAALRAGAHALAGASDPVRAIGSLQARLGPLESDADDAFYRLGIPDCTSR